MPMLSMSIALLLSQATTTAPAPAAEVKKKCRSEQNIGSRVRKRVCRTEAEWAEIDNASRNGQPQRVDEIRGYR